MDLVYPTSDETVFEFAEFLLQGEDVGLHSTLSSTATSPPPAVSTTVAVSLVTGYQYCAVFRIGLNTVCIGLLCILGLAGNSLSIAVLRIDRQNR